MIPVTKAEVLEAAGSLHLCAGHEAGEEAPIHAMTAIFEDESCDAVMFVDASNAFNNLNRKVALLNIRFIKIVSSHKHLGLILTPDLDWHDHINQLLLNASQRAGLLRWMSKDLKPSTVQQLYTYYLWPKFEYACPVWHGALLERDALALQCV